MFQLFQKLEETFANNKLFTKGSYLETLHQDRYSENNKVM